MAIKTDPFLGLKYGDDKGADNWMGVSKASQTVFQLAVPI